MDEQLRILKMVEEKTITAEQGVELLKAMGLEPVPQTQVAVMDQADYDKKMFRVVVDSVGGDKVNVQLPVKAVKRLLLATGKIPVPAEELKGFDLEELTSAVVECMDSMTMGDIVNVSAADGTVVRIYIG